MAYKISPYRLEFDRRTNALKSTAFSSSTSKDILADARDMIFQAAIFQSSAAMEDYLKSMFDDWIFKAKTLGLNCSTIPMRVRSSMAAQVIAKPIYKYAADDDEAELLRRLEREGTLWDLLHGGKVIQSCLEGSHIYKDRKYPSPKNVKALFSGLVWTMFLRALLVS